MRQVATASSNPGVGSLSDQWRGEDVVSLLYPWAHMHNFSYNVGCSVDATPTTTTKMQLIGRYESLLPSLGSPSSSTRALGRRDSSVLTWIILCRPVTA